MRRDHASKESNMDHRGTAHLVHLTDALPEGRLLRLPDARGHRIVTLSGDVWVTEQDRTEDIVLHAGDAVTLKAPGTALIMAFGSADIEVIPPPSGVEAIDAASDARVNFERYEQIARRLRAEAFRDAFVTLGCALRRLGSRIAAALGATPVTGSGPCRGTA
jgi:Protein of unknown function (DUF2917)